MDILRCRVLIPLLHFLFVLVPSQLSCSLLSLKVLHQTIRTCRNRTENVTERDGKGH